MNDLAKIIAEAIAQGPIDQTFVCKFCNSKFVRESTLGAHLCEPKRRHQQKDEVGVRLAYNAWIKFYEITQGSAKFKTYEDFCSSKLYGAFVKFGRYLHNTRVINPAAYTEWIIKSNKKLDHWTKDAFYSEYLMAYLRRENPQDALERGIVEMQGWADEKKMSVNQFFQYATPTRIANMISNGRISPWLIYCSDSGNECLTKFNAEQLGIVYVWIDPDFWQKKLRDYAADAEWCRHILREAGY
jgi:hypothetical protein